MGRSEGSQHIYSNCEPMVVDPISNKKRCMIEVGNIRGLEVDETANYVLIPMKRSGKKATAWMVHRLTKECEAEVVSWNDQEGKDKLE